MLLKGLKSSLDKELSINPNDSKIHINRYNNNLGKILLSSDYSLQKIKDICHQFISQNGFLYYNFGDFQGFSKDSDHFLLDSYSQNGHIIIDVSRNRYIESPF